MKAEEGNTMKKVLVLGANGHLGFNLTQRLVERGYSVRAGVRSVADKAKTAQLRTLGVELVNAELTKPEQLRAAMEGMDGVFQLAAVFNVTSENPQQEVKEPTITGTINAVRAAAEAGVKKFILTSSIASVGTVKPGGQPLTESSWNERAVEPYAQAKMESERRAWQLSKEYGLNMVAILPATMIGPGFTRHTPSTLSFELLLRGKVPFVLPLTFDFVDVRDVADAHILAYESAKASGRYIASNATLSLKGLFECVGTVNPDVRIPTRMFPSALLGVVPFLDWLGNKLEGTPRFASPALIKEYGGREQRVSSARIRAELGWSPMPIETSVRDTLSWVSDKFMHDESASGVQARSSR